MQTDRTIQVNRPNIVVQIHIHKTCLIIDITIPDDCNISVKAFVKLNKNKDLEIEFSKHQQYLL